MNDLVIVPVCEMCGEELSLEEFKLHVDRCDGCDHAWGERIEAWRNGGSDPALDRLWRDLSVGVLH